MAESRSQAEEGIKEEATTTTQIATTNVQVQQRPMKKAQLEGGALLRSTDTHVIPENRLGLVFLGLLCTFLLPAIDQTIIVTALPTIVARLGGGKYYSWVGTAYFLASAGLSPLYGKLSDLIGRKPVLYTSMFIFLIGSALCGAAQNMTWLIVSRAVQGTGGGGITQLIFILINDIVPLKGRGIYGGLIGGAWGVASVVGPVLGGVITDRVSWRWCFFINIPTGGFAACILFFFLNLNPHQGRTLREHVKEFDFIGLISMVVGMLLVLIGFNASETSWSSKTTIVCLVTGLMTLVLSAVNEMYTDRSPIIPPRLFKTRTTAIVLVVAFVHNVVIFTCAYYLPLYYQVLGSSATRAGIELLPFSLGSALSATVSGLYVGKYGTYRPVIWVGYGTFAAGMGLMIMLDANSSTAKKELYPFIAALGMGVLYQAPLIALQAAMPMKDMAISTGAYGIIRALGSTVGISIGQAIYSSTLRIKMAKTPYAGIDTYTSPAALSQSVSQLKNIPDAAARAAVIDAYAKSISVIWLAMCPLLGFCLFLTLFLRYYTLERRVVRRARLAVGVDGGTAATATSNGSADRQDGSSDGDAEKGTRALGMSESEEDAFESSNGPGDAQESGGHEISN